MKRRFKMNSIIVHHRRYLMGAALIILMSIHLYAQDVTLPSRYKSNMAFTETLNLRMSVRSFQQNPIPMEKLAWMLWAMGMCQIDGKIPGKIAVKMNGFQFLYDPEEHVLRLTAEAVPRMRIYEAPVQIFLLPMESESEEIDQNLWIWRGMAGQAVYLGAPALGLGTVTIRGIGFPLGYPQSVAPLEPRSLPENGSFPDLDAVQALSLDTLLTQFSQIPQEAHSISEETVSRLLWSAYGFSFFQDTDRIHRTVPSARGKYPMTVYRVSSKGLFRYISETHTLDTLAASDLRPYLSEITGFAWIGEVSPLLLLMWDTEKLSSRNSALYEAGAMLLNVQLMSQAMNLPSVWSTPDSDSLQLNYPDYTFPETQVPLMFIGIKKEQRSSGLQDGIYQGETNKWPEMKVEVTIQNGRIHKITILDDRGTPAFTERMKAVLPQRIIETSSTEVDGVSGATLSSNNLKKAVQDALLKAR